VGLGLNLALNAAGEIFVTNILPGFGLSLRYSMLALTEIEIKRFQSACTSVFYLPLLPSFPLSRNTRFPPLLSLAFLSLAAGAIKSGLIGLNDVLLQIDDTPVASMTLEETKARTTGIEVRYVLHASLVGSLSLAGGFWFPFVRPT
jgi:hypothetical protein